MKTTKLSLQTAKLLKKSLLTSALFAVTTNVALATDCDANGIADQNELETTLQARGEFDEEGFEFGCSEYDPRFVHYYDNFLKGAKKAWVSLPKLDSGTEVTLDFSEQQFNILLTNPSAFLNVYINGNYAGQIFNGNNGATLTLTSDELAAISGSEAENNKYLIQLHTTQEVCELANWEKLIYGPNADAVITYQAPIDHLGDENQNGWLDKCELGAEDHSGIPDSDGDGVVDSIDTTVNIADPNIVNGLGEVIHVPFYDQDQDGDVDTADLDALIAEKPESNFADIVKVLHASRGTNKAADPRLFQTLNTFGLVNSPLVPSPLSYNDAKNWAEELYGAGTQLASVDKYNVSNPLSQQAQLAELTSVMAQAGGSHWIGLKWSSIDTEFKWENNQFFDTSPKADVTSISNWVNGGQIPGSGFFTPGQDDYCVVAWASQQHQWLNTDCVTASLDGKPVSGFAVNLPETTVAEAPVTTTETVSVSLESSHKGKNVSVGELITWRIVINTSDDNNGLSFLQTDLEQSSSNPEKITFTPAMVGEADIENFAAPSGFNAENGFGGHFTNDALQDIGGAQNTLGVISNNYQHGQSASFIRYIGKNEPTVFAQGSFVAPNTVGTYQLSLANTLASVIKQYSTSKGAELVAANIDATNSTLMFTVIDSQKPELNLVGDSSVTQEVFTSYVDAGATAFDAEDGDLTNAIEVTNSVNSNTLGHYTVDYSVRDSAGLETHASRNVQVIDTTPPVFTLHGGASMTVNIGETGYREPGYTLIDNYGGDITYRVRKWVSENYELNLPLGTQYHIFYSRVADASGNIPVDSSNQMDKQYTRTVTVIDPHPGDGSFSVNDLENKTGYNRVNGGTGTDTYSFQNAPQGVQVDLLEGFVKNNGYGGEIRFHFIENIIGTNYDDSIIGSHEPNVIKGLNGNDRILGRHGDDEIHGNGGNDELIGDPGNDLLLGQNGSDTLYGNWGNDELRGGSGNDTLFGNRNNDLLRGGPGDDILYGGQEKDSFVFSSTKGIDTIKDFDANAGETLQIDMSVFKVSSVSQVSLSATGVLSVKGTNGVTYNLATLNSNHNITDLAKVIVLIP